MSKRAQKRIIYLFELAAEDRELYGLDIAKITGLGPGRLYPALHALEQSGYLGARFEPGEEPRRRVYWRNPGEPRSLEGAAK